MEAVNALTLEGDRAMLSGDVVEAFRERLHGPLLTSGDEGYDEARTVWNAMIDRRPALIARCTGAADVMRAVRFAREHQLLLSVRGGGHNVAGNAVCDGGLMIDLSPMSRVRVDPAATTARVGGGATMAELDHETQAFGLANAGGIDSSTGVAGITLGGGLGFLSRTHGLVHDNLRSVDVVTAEGDLVHASEDENPDLFWGMRGGGGNFGIATSFEFDLHELGPEILNVRVLHPLEAAPAALRFYGDFMADAPNEVQVYAAFSLTVAPKWEDPGRDEEMIRWARSFHAAVEPYSTEGVYVNYMDQDEGDRVADAYGDRMERLVALKNEWDPDNVFRMNQNIEPTRHRTIA